MEIIFILYKPANPRNVGAAARAMKTMGFSKLRLIDPCNHLSAEALMLAHASSEILENAEIYDHFADAVTDVNFIIGTTAKKRSVKEDYTRASELKNLLEGKKDHLKKIGIVFGTEESGLPNEVLAACDIASTIPIINPYPSLNLGQAIMLYSYELSDFQTESMKKKIINNESFHTLKARVSDLMLKIGIPEEMPLHSRILERISHMNSADINMLHSISARLDKHIG